MDYVFCLQIQNQPVNQSINQAINQDNIAITTQNSPNSCKTRKTKKTPKNTDILSDTIQRKKHISKSYEKIKYISSKNINRARIDMT